MPVASEALYDAIDRPLTRLMLRCLCVLAAVTLSGCGSDAAPPDEASTSVARASGIADPVEARLVVDDPAVRQRLSPATLLAYFPTMLGAREPIVRSNFLRDAADDIGVSSVRVLYRNYSDNSSAVIQIDIADLVDQPDSWDRVRIHDGQGLAPSGSGEVSDLRTLEGGVGQAYAPEGGGFPELYILLADRFLATFRAESQDMEPDALWDLYEASGLARLAGAPVNGEPGVPDVPTWATRAVTEWEESAPVASAMAEPVAATAPLPSCDAVLPVAEVERVCSVSGLRVYPSAFIDESATSCNRKYAVPGNLSGLNFMVSRYDDAARARAGQRVAADIENPRDLREVAGLGDAATRYVQASEAARTSTRVLAVATGVDLVEMKSTVMPEESDAEVCTLDQLETLARGVAERLRH